MVKKITRRKFVGQVSSAAVGAGVVLATGRAQGGKKATKTRIIEVSHPKSVGADRKVDPAAVRAMVQRGMRELTGKEKPFEHLFKPTDRVGLKINCLGRPLICTHHEVVAAFSAELEAAGVKPYNIIVWDRFDQHMIDCDYKLVDKKNKVRVLASETYDGEGNRMDPGVTYKSAKDNPEARADSGEVSRLSRIFTSEVDKVVNLAILKDHGLSGVTLCLKNIAFGVCDNNRRFHRRKDIDPFIADFCARKDVRDKFVLHVLDGIEGCFDHGPKPGSQDDLFSPGKIWFGFDPVAIDATGTSVIEAERKKRGLKNLERSGRHPHHIELSSKLGSGVADTARIQIKKISLG
jgi:uncharacterized protein (DUF362 family)